MALLKSKSYADLISDNLGQKEELFSLYTVIANGKHGEQCLLAELSVMSFDLEQSLARERETNQALQELIVQLADAGIE